MPKFRKKPVVIEALQLTKDSRQECLNFGGASISEAGEMYETGSLLIETLEGNMLVRLGDWIIKGVKGEFYPCKADIFEATYEPEHAHADRVAERILRL